MPQQKINLIGEKFLLWIWVFGIFKDLCDFFAVTMSINCRYCAKNILMRLAV